MQVISFITIVSHAFWKTLASAAAVQHHAQTSVYVSSHHMYADTAHSRISAGRIVTVVIAEWSFRFIYGDVK